MTLSRQMTSFVFVGLFAAVAHYGALIALVEGLGWAPIPATLVGYVCGGLTSYVLNRRHTFESDRSHGDAGWRFATVSGVGFALTWVLMSIFVQHAGLPYLAAQLVTTALIVIWSFLANKLWTFAPL
jgi:putative flippase GtrA